MAQRYTDEELREIAETGQFTREVNGRRVKFDPRTDTGGIITGVSKAVPFTPDRRATVPFDGPVTIDNPYTMPAEAQAAAIAEMERQQAPIYRQQSQARFADSTRELENMLLGVPNDPRAMSAQQQVAQTDHHFGEAFDGLVKARAYKAAKDRVALQAAMNQPGVTRSDVEAMRQQYAAKYPDYPAELEPLSPKQAAEQEQKIKLEEVRDTYEGLGLPRNLVSGFDEKGKPVEVISPSELLSLKNEQRRSEFEAVRDERTYYKDALAELRKTRPEPPEGLELMLPEEAKAAQDSYQRQLRLFTLREQSMQAKAFGFDPNAVDAFAEPERLPAPGERGSGRSRPEAVPAPPAESAQPAAPVRPHIDLDSGNHENVDEIIARGLTSGNWGAGTVIKRDGRLFRVTGGNPPLAEIH